MNSELITINKLELASELANEKLISKWGKSMQIFEDETAGITTYTNEAQDLFNEYYEEYIDLIESCEHIEVKPF